MQITKTSMFTGAVTTMDIDVTQEQLNEWENGKLIQEAMPDLSPDEREFIKTGVSPNEWNKMFGEV
tara:strand:- start:202 stop:399 length:198 start_codon:yes stop_codon:yes gene_type:complete